MGKRKEINEIGRTRYKQERIKYVNKNRMKQKRKAGVIIKSK
jgi:hypothetical protein